MYRPKSLRDHQLFHRTREALLKLGQNPSVHGGRRVVTRMLEAQRLGRRVGPLSFLCTEELRDTVIVPAIHKRAAGVGDVAAAAAIGSGAAELEPVKVFTASKETLEEIRGAKINTVRSAAVLSARLLLPHAPAHHTDNASIGVSLLFVLFWGLTREDGATVMWPAPTFNI